MSTDVKDPKASQGPSVTSLVTGIIQDAETLFKQQFELLKHEVHQDIRKARGASYTLATGAILGIVAAIVLVQMLVWLTKWLVPDLQEWACFGIWGAIAFGAGAVLILVGKNTLESVDPLPEQSAEALKEK